MAIALKRSRDGNPANERGARDGRTKLPKPAAPTPLSIAGAFIYPLLAVPARSGLMAEIFRNDWPHAAAPIRQVNWNEMTPGAVTDWHRHDLQTDRLIGVIGVIRLSLWDDRENSPTRGATAAIQLSSANRGMVLVPPGVWHGLRNETDAPAAYINLPNQLYDHDDPDNWRLPPEFGEAPLAL